MYSRWSAPEVSELPGDKNSGTSAASGSGDHSKVNVGGGSGRPRG